MAAGAEVQAFRSPIDRHGHPVVGQRDLVLGQALCLVAEEPGGGLFQRVDRLGGGGPQRRAAFSSWETVQVQLALAVRREDSDTAFLAAGYQILETSAPSTTGRWKRDPAVERTALGL